MRVWCQPVLRLICLICVVFSPVSRALASGAAAADEKAPAKAAAVRPSTPLSTVTANAQAKRLAVQNHIDTQSLVFFPVPGGSPEARFTAARPGYSLTLGQS